MKKNCLDCSKFINCKIVSERRKSLPAIAPDEKIEEAITPCEDFSENVLSNLFAKGLMNTAANSRQTIPTIHINTISINISIKK